MEFESLTALRAQVADLRGKIRALGSVNVSAIEEYKEVKARYDALMHQVTDVEESRNELTRMISKLSAQMREIFSDSFRAINENFGRVFTELFGGGEASLVLEDESDVLSCGIGIRVAPPGKVIKNLEALSGGEQALVAISIYFAILAVNPAPFCILDEIEAALDDANVVRFAQYLRRVSDKTSSSSSPTAAAQWKPRMCFTALPCRRTACPSCSSLIWNRLTQRWFPDIY